VLLEVAYGLAWVPRERPVTDRKLGRVPIGHRLTVTHLTTSATARKLAACYSSYRSGSLLALRMLCVSPQRGHGLRDTIPTPTIALLWLRNISPQAHVSVFSGYRSCTLQSISITDPDPFRRSRRLPSARRSYDSTSRSRRVQPTALAKRLRHRHTWRISRPSPAPARRLASRNVAMRCPRTVWTRASWCGRSDAQHLAGQVHG